MKNFSDLTDDIRQHTISTILWLTGWSMDHTAFDSLIALLPEFQHTCLDYSNADSPEDFLNRAEAAAANITEHSHSKLVIAGWSLGGLLALKLASQGLAHGLILIGTNAQFIRAKEQMSMGWPDAYLRQMLSGLQKDRNAVEMKFRQLLFTEAENQSEISGRLSSSGSWTTDALIAGLQLLRREECLSQLGELHCPVLLLHGTEDQICPFGAAEELYEQLPLAELIPLPGCGHVPFAGKETDIAEIIRRWWE